MARRWIRALAFVGAALSGAAQTGAARPAGAADGPQVHWIRGAAISPDGSRIAFAHRGDLWVVPAEGGAARPLTTHVGHERTPVWSPDGMRIAFASDRHGNFDVFVMSAAGGPATRLTRHSAGDFPYDFTPDGSEVVFGSTRTDAPEAVVTSTWLPELYAVPAAGGRARMLLTTAAESVRLSPDGARVLYEDRKGYENPWRKHHTSSVARDVWMWTPGDGKHVKLTTFAGEDRDPRWLADGASFAYLSERSGSFNVWRQPTLPGAEPSQMTNHSGSPVRFLSAARDGTLCYVFDGALWIRRPEEAESRRLEVSIAADDRTNELLVETRRDGATEMAPSPEGDEVALVVRGDVFVCSTKHGTTRRLTDTPGMERSVSWAPDGRAVWYAGERDGSWNLYRTVLAKEGESRFVQATEVREETMLATPKEEFQPLVSPDGRLVAYLEDRDTTAVLDLAARTTRTLVPADLRYSYADGDLVQSWSPDSRWLAFTYSAHRRWSSDVGVVEVATGLIRNATESGYEEDFPRWTADGRALVFQADRLGRRPHGSWGGETDLFAFDLTRDARTRAQLSKEEHELLRKREEDEKKKAEAAKPAPAPGAPKAEEKEEPPPEVTIEWTLPERRVRRLTMRSAPIGGWAVSPDGETVVYWAQVEDRWDLWAARPRARADGRIVEFGSEEPGEVVFAKDGKSVFVRTSEGAVARVTLQGLEDEEGGGPGDGGGGGGGGRGGRGGGGGGLGGNREDVRYAAELRVDLAAERAAMFEHAWRQAGAKFYDPKLHGVDWAARREEYARFLADAVDGWDFAELLSEMLGELNASHTGGRYRPDRRDGDETAALGLLFDPAWTGDGLRVAEVLPDGPFDRGASKVVAGSVVTAIDGEPVAQGRDPAELLNRKAGKHVVVTVRTPAGEDVAERALAISAGDEAELLYRRWVERCRAAVESASGGRVGYVHVRGMNDASFRETFSDALGRNADREALLVDTRWNGGGWLHDDLIGFLEAREYLRFLPRGKELGRLGTEPLFRWSRPVAVVMNEGNYSDAHVFPYAFRALGVGKLIGAPVAGTGTAVWWERQVDPSIVFGVPQVGLVTPEGSYLENSELPPDVLVLPDPADLAKGVDAQLVEAVRVLLEEADARK